ncbi:cation:proton antiporter [Rhodocyclus tenuis]|uniref:CPA2 family monovalent cation:H+ antiporter-2 n=1 Tax=Rhodocyclus tenuis TaxID=1066 RepID=A0A840G5G5_RHOTE|nr:cation:proton antiporter [Rhodocyclus tenuis]MBB4246230.1 CPA2 family monovalent cation:H+ antiporter-2 [Rhodocyclus tenuis]
MHEFTLISTLVAAFALALVFGLIAARLKVPPLIGYLLAGVAIGPATPGFVGDLELAAQLAEIGVMLLMFGVGLHFSLGDLLSVRRIALPGAVVQIGVATALGTGLALAWGWSLGAGLVLGLSLSCASTVVLLRALEARGILQSADGRIAVGWLVVEDLVCVLVLVLMPALATVGGGGDAAEQATGQSLWLTIGIMLAKVSAFIALMVLVGRRALPRLLWIVSGTGSRELFVLCVIAVALGVAYGSAALFGVSFALGAFFAGTVMRESAFAHRAAEESLPLRDAFSVLFFVSVGMLFDPAVIIEQPGKLAAVVVIIIVGKTLAAIGLVLALRYPLGTAMTVGASLAQIGEFSFILAGLGVALDLLPKDGQSLILAGALISIAANSLVFAAIPPIRRWLLEHSRLARELELRVHPTSALPDPVQISGQVVVVGYGRVGRRIVAELEANGIKYLVVEQQREKVEDLRTRGVVAVTGDAADPTVLVQAHVADAAMLVIATPDTLDIRRIAELSRRLNPGLGIVVRTHSEEEAELLRQEAIGTVFLGEHELADGMSRHVLARLAQGED